MREHKPAIYFTCGILVASDDLSALVEIFIDDEEGAASAGCHACPWTEGHRGHLDDTINGASIHIDHQHPGVAR